MSGIQDQSYRELDNGYLEVIDYVSVNNRIKKKLFIDGEWQEQLFIQCDWSPNLEKWLREKYISNGYLKDWWITGSRVTINDKVYVHWKLCN